MLNKYTYSVSLYKKHGVEYPSVAAAQSDIRPVIHITLQHHVLYLQVEQATAITVQQKSRLADKIESRDWTD